MDSRHRSFTVWNGGVTRAFGNGRRLRVVLHFVPGTLDIAPPLIRELGGMIELHAILEVPPRAWETNALGLPHPGCRSGVVDALPHLRTHLPAALAHDFERAASVSYAVYSGGHGLRALADVWAALRSVRAIRPHLIHFEGESPRAAAWCALAAIPFISGMHEVVVPPGSTYRHLAIVKWLTAVFCRRLILHSQAAEAALREAHPRLSGKAFVVPLGVMETFASFASYGLHGDGRAKVVFFGRLTPRKGVDVFVQAARYASQRTTNVDFVVAGRPVRGTIPPSSTGLQNGCQLIVRADYLDPHSLAALIAESTVVVAPYLDARQSGVVLTAYAFRVPVIASRVGGLAEQVVDGVTGMLVPPGDAASLADAILAALADPGWRKRAAQEIERRSDVGCLSWRSSARSTLRVYADALPGFRPPQIDWEQSS